MRIRSSSPGTPALESDDEGAGSFRIAAIVSAVLLRWNSRRPESISCSTQPSAKMSDRASGTSPCTCSGDMYPRVPRIDPGSVGYERVTASALPSSADVCLARPKSRILMRSSAVTKMFSGLRSRWTTPCVCAAARPSATKAANLDGLLPRQPAACQPPPERFALQELGDQVPDAVVGPDVVDREDVRVGQRGDGARLALKPRKRVGIAGETGRDGLDRDVTPQPRVAGPIHLAHATRAQQRQDLIGTERRARFDAHAPRRPSLVPPTAVCGLGANRCSLGPTLSLAG